MITKEEFKKTFIRMMDTKRTGWAGGWSIHEPNCNGLLCNSCPFNNLCDNNSSIYNAFEAIELVEKWGKEHPIVTRADKYKEVFGIEPKYLGGSFICPGTPRNQDYCDSHTCEECKSNYWNEEYVEPEKENKNV